MGNNTLNKEFFKKLSSKNTKEILWFVNKHYGLKMNQLMNMNYSLQHPLEGDYVQFKGTPKFKLETIKF